MRNLACIIMAGGKSTRFDYTQGDFQFNEKPLLPIRNKLMIDLILDEILKVPYLKPIIVATSPYTPNTTKILSNRAKTAYKVVQAPGKSYHDDLQYIIKQFQLHETLILTADLPTIDATLLNQIIRTFWEAKKPAFSVMTEVSVVRDFDPKLICPENLFTTSNGQQYYPVAINFVDGRHIEEPYIDQGIMILTEKRILYNINRIDDYYRYLHDFP